ncbi:MAG: hypothetical protein IJX14_02340, partial [Clostridia bacterium]|nr:hypothetical protein [Clostridia bacterium]
MEKKEFNRKKKQSGESDNQRKRYGSRPGYGADRESRSRDKVYAGQKPERDDDFVREPDAEEMDTGLVIGRNAVRELLKSGRPVDKLYVSGREGSIVALVAEAKKAGVPVVD